MKKLVLVILFLALAIGLSAQDNDSIRTQYAYCELVGTNKFMSSKVNVVIDFGQEQNFWTNKDSRIRDEDGNIRNFNSMVDALNFMGALGWEFVQAYVVTSNNQNIYHWLLKKAITKAEFQEIKDLVKKKEK